MNPLRSMPLALTVGFGTAVGMWILGFVAHLPGVRVPGPILVPLLGAVIFAGGAVAGRHGARGTAALLAGAVTGLVNLLILGSVLGSEDPGSGLRPNWIILAGGSILFAAVLAALGAAFVRPDPARSSLTAQHWLARFAWVTVASALPVLLSGGLVTSTNTGLAVPDWPTSYNANMFLYPLSKMTGGIYYEHAHRLFGSLVGLTTLTLVVFTFLAERRLVARTMTALAIVFVCAQGVLGGVRVTSATVTSDTMSPDTLADNTTSMLLAMVHGTTAQLFVAFLCATATVLSRRWASGQRGPADKADGVLAGLAAALPALLLLQLLLGSAARHLHQSHAAWTHAGFAIIVLVAASAVGFRAAARHAHEPLLRTLGKVLSHTVGLQFVLGVATFIAVLPYERGKIDPPYAVIIATSHQALGAVLFGAATLMVLWARRLAAPSALDSRDA
ncbi:MAG: COX15/CtaA family protein [Planctomycetota bacterium]|nr:COX15/CtaA family protein [Planctomycetota bacterium]